MESKKILIISNKGLSNNESNGRILSLLLHNYDDKYKHNYCLSGYLDIEGVHYIRMGDMRNIKSLLDILYSLSKIDPSVVINLYGKISDEDLSLLDKYNNVKYNGIVKYEELINIYKNADMLLHMEGFSDYSVLDYKYAFSTKISDCYMLGIPFFMYSPIEIASTKYGLDINPDYVAISKDELDNKLSNVINNQTKYDVDANKIKGDFSPSNLI